MRINKGTTTMTVARTAKLLGLASVIALATAGISGTAQAQTAASPAASTAPAAAPVQDEFAIQFRADTMIVTPVLSTGLMTSERTVVAGQKAEFLAFSNYPAFVTRSEIRIFAAGQSPDATPLATAAVDANGHAEWAVPLAGPTALYFVHRVYGADGKFDETSAHEMTVVDHVLTQSGIDRGAPARPSFGQLDEAARRTIEMPGLMATVTGRARTTDVVRVSGQSVPVDESGHFAAQYIVPRSDAGMVVSITRDGAVVKEQTQSFAVAANNWFVVGQGEVTLGHSYGSGPAVIVSGDPLADGSYAIGRGAFYARGALENGMRVTASLDTGEALLSDIFSNLDRKDPRQLLRRIDSNQYYPTYGDDSTLVEDAPTQGRFYLRVANGPSQVVVGNFTTSVNGAELAQLDRGLFGALIDLNTTDTTSFGERTAQFTAFASDPGTVPAREEFRGTGGSLYFLRRQDVSVGSERVRIEVRDRTTGIVLESRELHAQQDYDFDPFQGRLTLLKPLSSTVATDGVVRDGTSSGNVPVVVVRYEYTPPVGSLDGYTVGGRASMWLTDQLRVAVTGQRDTVEEASQTLIGADAMVRIAAGTYFKSEIAQTRGPGFAQSNSVDGGLSFTDITNPGTSQTAQAWRTELAVDFAELAHRAGDAGALSAYFEHFDQGFSSAGRLMADETERWGTAFAVPLGTDGKIAAKFDQITSAALGRSQTGTADFAQKWGAFGASLGLRYEDRAPGLLYNSVQSGQRLDAAVQFEVRPANSAVHGYAFGQATLDRDAGRARNNRGGVGIGYELTDRMTLAGEISDGDGGIGADIHVNHRLAEGSEAYAGFLLSPDRTDLGSDVQNIFTRSDRGTLTVGARHRFSDALSIHGESRSSVGGSSPSLTRSFGLNFAPTNELSFTGSVENGQIDDATTGLFRRFAASAGVGYASDRVRFSSSVEMRNEHGAAVDQSVWLLRNDASLKLSPDWRAIGRLNMAFADTDSPSVRAAEYTEAVAGMAYRPVNNERLNALFRVMYYEDLGPVGQATGSGQTQTPKQTSTVLSLDMSYDLSEHFSIAGKYGYRSGTVSLGRDSDVFVRSDAHLGVVRGDYHVNRAWDIMAEGRVLRVSLSDETRLGALGAVYRHVTDNVKIGVGYSWSDFSDDLTDQSYTSHGPFLNLLGTF
jgi:hypothetical protein